MLTKPGCGNHNTEEQLVCNLCGNTFVKDKLEIKTDISEEFAKLKKATPIVEIALLDSGWLMNTEKNFHLCKNCSINLVKGNPNYGIRNEDLKSNYSEYDYLIYYKPFESYIGKCNLDKLSINFILKDPIRSDREYQPYRDNLLVISSPKFAILFLHTLLVHLEHERMILNSIERGGYGIKYYKRDLSDDIHDFITQASPEDFDIVQAIFIDDKIFSFEVL